MYNTLYCIVISIRFLMVEIYVTHIFDWLEESFCYGLVCEIYFVRTLVAVGISWEIYRTKKRKGKMSVKLNFRFLRSTRFNTAYVVTTNMTCLLRSSKKKKKLLIRFKNNRTPYTLTMDIIHQRFGPTDNGNNTWCTWQWTNTAVDRECIISPLCGGGRLYNYYYYDSNTTGGTVLIPTTT